MHFLSRPTLVCSLLIAALSCSPAFAQTSSKSKTVKSKSTGDASSRTKAEVDALILKEGRTPPPWFSSTPLNYPKSLKLDWPEPAGGGWNNQVNVGQYVWDVINPNESKWREGVRLMHHLLQLNSKKKDVVERCCNTLGHLYTDCLEDYARGAFWYRQAGGHSLDLALCYWKLGSKSAAAELLRQYGDDDTRNGSVIKLWADMGEFDTALKLAEVKARDDWADVAHLAAGDVYRLASRYSEALDSYKQVLEVKNVGRDIQRSLSRAKSCIEAITLFDALDPAKIPDGAYKQKSLGYEADIEVEATVKSGKITGVRITQHKEKQYYSAFTDTPRQIVEKQGVKGVDATTGATITSQAVINATAKALAGGMRSQ
jgi:uncharacterized protein with FMN-binding domain